MKNKARQFKVVVDRVMDDGVTPWAWAVKQLLPRRLGGERRTWVRLGGFLSEAEAKAFEAEQIRRHGEFLDASSDVCWLSHHKAS